MKNIGPTELLVLFAIVTFFFGSKIAMGIGRASGQTLKEIKKIKNEILGDLDEIDTKSSTNKQKEVE